MHSGQPGVTPHQNGHALHLPTTLRKSNSAGKKKGGDLNLGIDASSREQIAPKDHTGAQRRAHRTGFS